VSLADIATDSDSICETISRDKPIDICRRLKRVILRARGQIWILTVYGKNVRETIAAHLLRQMKEAIYDAEDD